MWDFSGKATPDSDAGAAGTAGDVGAAVGDAGGILGALGAGARFFGSALPGAGMFGPRAAASPGMSEAGAGMSAVGNFVQGASEIAQGQVWGGLGDIGASVTNAAAYFGSDTLSEGAGKGLGIAGGVMQAVGHEAEALQHTDQIDKGYQNNQFWTEQGNATLGAANAVASYLGPEAQLYVGAVQGGLDLAGDIAGMINPDWKFTAGSAIGGAEHAIYDGVRWAGNEASQLGSEAMAGLSNVGSGIADAAGSAVNSVENFAGSAVDTAGSALSSVGNGIADAAGSAVNSVENFAGSAVDTAGSALSSVGNGIADAAGSAVNSVENFAGSAVSAVSNW
jgi:hypothetical protein